MTALSTLAVATPTLLVYLHLGPVALAFDGDRIVIGAGMTRFPEVATWAVLLFSSFALVVGSCFYGARVGSVLQSARRAVHVQAWQLQQLAAGTGSPTRDVRPRPAE